MNIENHGLDAIVTTEKVGFVYTATNRDDVRDLYETRQLDNTFDWASSQYPTLTKDLVLLPHGNYNDLPVLIRDVVYNNYIAPGLLKKKTNILWGNGPVLYKDILNEQNQPERQIVEDTEIQDWLESFNYSDYLLKQVVDFNFIEGTYTKFIRNKGARIGRPAIAALEHLSAKDTRLIGKQESPHQKPKPTKVAVSEWGFTFNYHASTDMKIYDIFDFKNPFKHPQSVLYSNFPSFCVDFYSLPDIYGTLEWIRRSTAIPLLLKAMSKNGINIKYHIESPSKYWEEKRAEIKEKCTLLGKQYKDEMLEEFRMDLFRQISEILSGYENTGKFWHTVRIFDDTGMNLVEAGWTIKPIEQNLKDFLEAQIKLSERADYAVSSGLQIHSALGGVGQTGKSDSGSEQLYAIKNYMATSIRIPEMIVCKAINHAINANWPHKKISLGFNHPVPKAEQEVSPSDRFKENI